MLLCGGFSVLFGILADVLPDLVFFLDFLDADLDLIWKQSGGTADITAPTQSRYNISRGGHGLKMSSAIDDAFSFCTK